MQLKRIHEFSEKLLANAQVLETMGKLNDVNGYVRTSLEKLPGIRADLVSLDDDWQEWGFPQLLEALRKWCERNPIVTEERKKDLGANDRLLLKSFKLGRVLQAQQDGWKPKPCVYCDSTDHR